MSESVDRFVRFFTMTLNREKRIKFALKLKKHVKKFIEF